MNKSKVAVLNTIIVILTVVSFALMSYFIGFVGGLRMSVGFLLFVIVAGFITDHLSVPWFKLSAYAAVVLYGWHSGVIEANVYYMVQDRAILWAIAAFILFNMAMYIKWIDSKRPPIQATRKRA